MPNNTRNCGRCVSEGCPVRELLMQTAESRREYVAVSALRATGCPVIDGLEKLAGVNYNDTVRGVVRSTNQPIEFNNAPHSGDAVDGVVAIDFAAGKLTDVEKVAAMTEFGRKLLAEHKACFGEVGEYQQQIRDDIDSLRQYN